MLYKFKRGKSDVMVKYIHLVQLDAYSSFSTMNFDAHVTFDV